VSVLFVFVFVTCVRSQQSPAAPPEPRDQRRPTALPRRSLYGGPGLQCTAGGGAQGVGGSGVARPGVAGAEQQQQAGARHRTDH
jgi:hypothetical protein